MAENENEDFLGMETSPVVDRHMGPEADSVCVFCPVGKFVGDQVSSGRKLLSRILTLLPSFKSSAVTAGDPDDLGNNGDVIASEKYVGVVSPQNLRPYESPKQTQLVSGFDPYITPYSAWNRDIK